MTKTASSRAELVEVHAARIAAINEALIRADLPAILPGPGSGLSSRALHTERGAPVVKLEGVSIPIPDDEDEPGALLVDEIAALAGIGPVDMVLEPGSSDWEGRHVYRSAGLPLTPEDRWGP